MHKYSTVYLLGCACSEWDIKFHEYNYKLYYMYLCTVDCGPPGIPQRGSTNYTNTIEGSVAFYSCDEHLVPEGRMMANCTRNGWSPINPGRLRCTEGTLIRD